MGGHTRPSFSGNMVCLGAERTLPEKRGPTKAEAQRKVGTDHRTVVVRPRYGNYGRFLVQSAVDGVSWEV